MFIKQKKSRFWLDFFFKFIWTRSSVFLCLPSLWDFSSFLTLPVDPERMEQLGATQLSTEQGYIQLH